MFFMLSLQDIEDDNKVVNIIEDWDVLAGYAGEKLGYPFKIADLLCF